MTSGDLLHEARSHRVKAMAKEHGFLDCRIAKSGKLDREAHQLEEWLNGHQHGEMAYMENYFEQRTDTRVLMPDSKSVVSLCFNYFTDQKQGDPSAPKISQYAFGKDYHKVVKKRLKAMIKALEEEFGQVMARGFVDSAPVLEKAWAARSGLGWIGKNANLLSKQHGSFFFLAEIILDLELAYDEPMPDYCGTCTRCIDACPTDAIVRPYVVDGSKCISYFTIELKSSRLPSEMKGKFENWMFGCDICQEVCPWNSFSRKHTEPKFEAKQALLDMTKDEWQDLTRDQFDQLFEGSAVKRTGYEGLIRNINFLGVA